MHVRNDASAMVRLTGEGRDNVVDLSVVYLYLCVALVCLKSTLSLMLLAASYAVNLVVKMSITTHQLL